MQPSLLRNASNRSAPFETKRRKVLLSSISICAPFFREEARAEASTKTFCAPDVVSALGITYCDERIGDGPAPKKGDVVRCHYRGRLASNEALFDSSYERGRPLTFTVGVGQVIRGWDMAILGGEDIPAMKAGGKRTVLLPSSLAYGERGAGGGIIPPDSDLVFDIELVGKNR